MREQERRQQIMQAAERLFANRRFHEITTDEIAATAGVGKGTIYRYFKDKEDLFHQTAMHGFEELCELLESDRQTVGPLEDRLLQACRRIDSFYRRRRKLFGMMQAEENRLAFKRGRKREQWRERRRHLTEILVGMLDEAVAKGELRADIATESLAGYLLGMLKGHAFTDSGDGNTDMVAGVVDVFLHGANRREGD